VNITEKLSDGAVAQLEDPFFWVCYNDDDTIHSFHALFHNMGACQTGSCHSFSTDGYTWRQSINGAYKYNFSYDDGSTFVVSRSERPHLLFDESGRPTHLVNGVQDLPDDDHTYTHVQPINVW